MTMLSAKKRVDAMTQNVLPVADRDFADHAAKLLEAIPHVPAYCYLADDVGLPDGLDYVHSPACEEFRQRTALAIFAAGFRRPPRPLNWLTKLPPPLIVSDSAPETEPE